MPQLERHTEDSLGLTGELAVELHHPEREVHWRWLVLLVLLLILPAILDILAGDWIRAGMDTVIGVVAALVGYRALVKKLTITRF